MIELELNELRNDVHEETEKEAPFLTLYRSNQ